MIRLLTEVGRTDVALVGGKGANLGEMTRLGLPVPPGFCVTTGAYLHAVAGWGLSERLSPLLGAGDWEAVAAAAERLFAEAVLDPALEEQVLQAYRDMGSPAVAVRSSATAEDLASASFAGQQETFLGVEGEAALLAAVRRCWASLWSPRALHYRAQRGIDHLKVSMAVVVQAMVPAKAAGVLFTVDPVAQRSDRMLIEAAPGLGEAVVSGAVTGDSYRVERGTAADTIRVVEQDLRQPVRPVLSEGEVLALCRVGLQLEAHYGCPQDVEFALAGGSLSLLQTRPVTTATGVEPEPVPPVGTLAFSQRFGQNMVAERYPIAPKPLDQLVMDVLMTGYAETMRAAGYVVTPEAEAAAREPVWRPAFIGPYGRPTPGMFFRLPGFIRRLLNREWVTWWEQEMRPRLLEASRERDLAVLSDQELLDLAESIQAVWRDCFRQRFVSASAYFAESWLRGVAAVAVGWRQSGRVMLDLMAGLETHTSETNAALWQLSRVVRSKDPAVAERFQAFQAAYGHRAGAAWYVSQPTWRKDPERVWHMVQGLAGVVEAPRDTGPERYAAARQLVEQRLRFWPWLPGFFRWLVDRFRVLQVFRENSNFDLTRPLAALQAVCDEWGRRLTDRGLLRTPSEVYYLAPADVRAWLTGGAPDAETAAHIIARRRTTYQLVNSRWQARLFQAAGAGDTLRGVGASPGAVRARARVIRGEHQFSRLQPGEVLVCPYSNPSWTPLFASAAAVVAETGGAMSHAAIVAREYGIPAVMGVAGALQRIEDGQELLVDGDAGRVVLGRHTETVYR